MTRFFFWPAWAAATEGEVLTASDNNSWPHEPLIDNNATAKNMVQSIVSVVVLLVSIGFLVWGQAFLRNHEEGEPTVPAQDAAESDHADAFAKKTGRIFAAGGVLFGFQVLMGGMTARYTVECQDFYGLPLSTWFPYSLTRTWHLQSAMLWIATDVLDAGLLLASFIDGGEDPKYQNPDVDLLSLAVVLVVMGSYTSMFLAIAQPAIGRR